MVLTRSIYFCHEKYKVIVNFCPKFQNFGQQRKLIVKTIWKYIYIFVTSSCCISCSFNLEPTFPEGISNVTGSEFYKSAVQMNWKSRDSFAVSEILEGNIPDFQRRFVKVNISDYVNGRYIKAYIFVAPDYLSIGNNDDWARICITPMAAQIIADSFHCFLPTKKIVDKIFNASTVRLIPVPMFAFRDSTPTMWHHHLIIEGQRKGRKGLISGIKKDVVLSYKISENAKPDRVAIYGWHYPDGSIIQPLYTGHVNWYVDYSHGIRLVYENILIDGKMIHYTEILKHQIYRQLLCDEPLCSFFRYSY